MIPVNERLLKLSALVSGITAMILQVVALRESLGIFQGNELVIGLVLGSWMLLTAFGSWLGDRLKSRSSVSHVATFLFLMAFFSVVTVWGAVYLRAVFFPPGVMADVVSILLFTIAALGPYCIISGALFPVLVRIYSENAGTNLTHRVYALESLGSIAGGLLFSLVLVMILETHQVVALLALVLMATAVILGWKTGWRLKAWVMAALSLGWCITILIINPENVAAWILLKPQEIFEISDTPFGKLTISGNEGQLNIYENGIPVYSGEDISGREESVHFALMQVTNPRKILMISGGLTGAIPEVLKYPDVQLDYVESDPWMSRMVKPFLAMPQHDSVRYIFQDGRRFLQASEALYDAILVNLSAPVSAGVNRYFTVEFFREASACLSEKGVFCISLPGGNQYLAEESRLLHSSVLNSLREVFPFVRLVPGQRHYFLASGQHVDKPYKALFNEKKWLGNQYVNEDYFRDDLLQSRAENLLRSLDSLTPVNTDLRPYSYSLYIRFWLSHFKPVNRFIPMVPGLLVLVFLILLPPVRLGLFTTGLTSASFEFILMVILQVALGNLYWLAGLVFAAFMAGIASGSWFRDRLVRSPGLRAFLTMQASMATLCLLAAFSLPLLTLTASPIMITVIFMLVLVTGFITGLQFAIAAICGNGIPGAGSNYAADLAGSAFGVWLVTVFVLPQAGIIHTCRLLAGLNLLTLVLVRIRSKKS